MMMSTSMKTGSPMRKLSELVLTALLLAPFASHANEVELPELGLRVIGLPSGIATPQVNERPAGYDATIDFGAGTFISIYRQEKPVSPGSLLDADYRKSLLTNVDAAKDVRSAGKIISVGGHDAWMVIDAHVPNLLQIHACALYVVVDEHVYQMLISALAQKSRFMVFVNDLVARVTFEPIRRADAPGAASPRDANETPRFLPGRFVTLYPAPSLRRGEQGAVDVEFSIDGQGNVRDLKQTYAAYRGLAQEVQEYLARGMFRVPPEWEQTESDKRRFVMEFQFMLVPPGSTCPARPDPPRVPAAKVVSVCEQALSLR